MKKCSKCNNMKLESEFHVGRGRPCKTCRIGENVDRKKEYDIEYRKNNKEKLRIRRELYAKNNREILNQKSNERRQKQRNNLSDNYIKNELLRKTKTPVTENSIANKREAVIKFRNAVIANKQRRAIAKTRKCISCKETKLSNIFLSSAGKYCDKCRESKEKEKKAKKHAHDKYWVNREKICLSHAEYRKRPYVKAARKANGKKYRKTPKAIATQLIHSKLRVVNIMDHYVKQLIRRGSKILSNKDIPDAFVKAKKLQIQLIRNINENGQPLRRNRHKLSDRITL